MIISDGIGDMLVRIKNGYMAKLSKVLIPFSGEKERTLKVLLDSKLIANFLKSEAMEFKPLLEVELLDNALNPSFEVKRISKPGRRVYMKAKEIYPVKGKKGILLVSTSKGVMTGAQAKKLALGGEVLAEIF